MQKKLRGIEMPRDEYIVWRYMSFDRFVDILAKKSLFFTRADRFEDPYEGYKPKSIKLIQKEAADRLKNNTPSEISEIFNGNSQEKFLENWRRYVMCSCWHHNDGQSVAMWKIYSAHNNGVAIKTTMGNLKASLSDEHDVYIGKVNYDTKTTYEHRYWEDLAFSPRSSSTEEQFKKILYFPYFRKETVYKYENEVRIIIDSVPLVFDYFYSNYPESATQYDLGALINTGFPDIWKDGLPIKIDVEKLFGKTGKVIISPYADKWIIETVESVVRQYGFQFPVKRSQILDPPDQETFSV